MIDMMIIDQVGCARCGCGGHVGLQFLKFTQPVMRDDKEVYTFWSICPDTGEPILMEVVEKEDPLS